MIKQKKTKKKNVNVNQTVVVNIQKGKRNPRAKASAPQAQAMSAPQIIPPQVGSAYHQVVYGARAPVIPSMGNVPGYYAGMMSPFHAPLHVASELQQAQLRQMNDLAGANLQRKMVDKSMETVNHQGKDEAMPNLWVPPTIPLSKPFSPSFSMEAPEPASSSSASASASGYESPSPPIEEIEAPGETKQAMREMPMTYDELSRLPFRRKDKNDTRIFLTDVAKLAGIQLPRGISTNKYKAVQYIVNTLEKQ